MAAEDKFKVPEAVRQLRAAPYTQIERLHGHFTDAGGAEVANPIPTIRAFHPNVRARAMARSMPLALLTVSLYS